MIFPILKKQCFDPFSDCCFPRPPLFIQFKRHKVRIMSSEISSFKITSHRMYNIYMRYYQTPQYIWSVMHYGRSIPILLVSWCMINRGPYWKRCVILHYCCFCKYVWPILISNSLTCIHVCLRRLVPVIKRIKLFL